MDVRSTFSNIANFLQTHGTFAMLLIIVLPIILASLWYRRSSFSCRWERCNTVALMFMGVGVMIDSPLLAKDLDPPAWLDPWNLTEVLASTFLICAAGAICRVLIEMGLEKPQIAPALIRWVRLPATIGNALAVACYFLGKGWQGTLDGPPSANAWIAAYWVFICFTIAYLLTLATWLLGWFSLQRRHRPVVIIYLVACASGATAWAMGGVSAICQTLLTPHDVPGFVLVEVWFIGMAVGAAEEWRRKTKALRDFRKKVSKSDAPQRP